MKRRHLLIALTFALCFCAVFAAAEPAGGRMAKGYYTFDYVVDEFGTGIIITGYQGSIDGEVTIPETLEGLPVVRIEDGAFSGCNNATKFTIEAELTSIGANAFFNCDKLANIIIPSTVKTIGAGAFSGCRSLTSIEIPDGIARIEDDLFYSCINLANVDLPSTVSSIGKQAFYWCKLSSIEIPDNVAEIDDSTFANWNSPCHIPSLTSIPRR